MDVAQAYAHHNRELILCRILMFFNEEHLDRVNSTHNFIEFTDYGEYNILRKGAVPAYGLGDIACVKGRK